MCDAHTGIELHISPQYTEAPRRKRVDLWDKFQSHCSIFWIFNIFCFIHDGNMDEICESLHNISFVGKFVWICLITYLYIPIWFIMYSTGRRVMNIDNYMIVICILKHKRSSLHTITIPWRYKNVFSYIRLWRSIFTQVLNKDNINCYCQDNVVIVLSCWLL